MRHKEANIEVGRRFVSLGSKDRAVIAWEVARTFRSRIDSVAYASLVQVADPSRQKTVACGALLDPRHFTSQASPPAGRLVDKRGPILEGSPPTRSW